MVEASNPPPLAVNPATGRDVKQKRRPRRVASNESIGRGVELFRLMDANVVSLVRGAGAGHLHRASTSKLVLLDS